MRANFIRCDDCNNWMQWTEADEYLPFSAYRCDGCSRTIRTHNDKPMEVREVV